MTRLRYHYLGPVVLIALCLVTLCTITAVSLFRQQATVTSVLRENVESRRAAVALEECLTDLIDLEKAEVETVEVMHHRIRVLLSAVGQVADQPEERELHRQMAKAFAAYLTAWAAMPGPSQLNHGSARLAATRDLEATVLKPCQEFKAYNASRIETSTEHHERVLRQLAWGMAGVGGLGGVAGVVLGYGVARGLAQSLHRLRVQIRDAAGKLGPHDLPEIVVTSDGDFHGLHAEVSDLAERIEQLLRTLNQRDREVLRAEQLAAVGQLAAGVAHEIRNPLTAIKMLIQAGLEEGADRLPADDLRIILAEIRRTERSLQTFLDFARPPKPEWRSTDLTPIIRGVTDLINGRAVQQRVAVQLTVPTTPMIVSADPDQLRQVFVNLCLNALDAMPTGGTLVVRAESRSANRVVVELADTGSGFADELLARLFQPFVSTKETGLGLGLVITQRILQDHNGQISVGNRVGGGARVLVTLPLGDHRMEGEYADAVRD